MYGAQETSTMTGATLAVTGMTAASWVLVAVGGVCLLIGLYLLVRKPGEHRP